MCCRRSPDHLLRPLLLLLVLAVPQAARAHRPFDVADATVAEMHSVEAEIGVRYRVRGEAYGNEVPFGLTMGIDERTELALAARVNPAAGDGAGREAKDLVFAAKHVFRAGSMQDAAGVSIAGECALVVAALRSSDAGGGSCALIASQRFDAADVHVNAVLGRHTDARMTRHFGVALEGPEAWTVRPLAELSTGRAPGEGRSYAGLLGLSWQPAASLSLGLALRREHAEGARTSELRFGLQWTVRN